MSDKDIYNTYMGVIIFYQQNPGVALLAGDTPAPLHAHRGTHKAGFAHIVRFLYNNTSSADSQNLAEYIEGAGSTADDFASLVMLHIDRTMPDHPEGYSWCTMTVFFMTGLLRLLVESEDDGALGAALLRRGFVKQLTDLLSNGGHFEEQMLHPSLFKTGHFPKPPPGYRGPPVRSPHCSHNGPFSDADLTASWQLFNTLATEFVHILQSYRTGGYSSFHGCDNMKVAFIHAHPGATFYTVGTLQYDVRAVNQIARATRSDRRMALVVVLVTEGLRTRRRLIPLRTRTSTVFDGLMLMGAEIPGVRRGY
ncbi:hypothetical protein FB451DRAFT_1174697 [Mycena latifolia]|nr:hypothetical protein FB451DRAFT_1174697 [Mycena latifolia]